MLSCKLEGKNRAELNTEIRFFIATAKAEDDELVELGLCVPKDSQDEKRIFSCIVKVLNAMQKENLIQFFATPQGFSDSSTEAEFLKNKFQGQIKEQSESISYFYVKAK